MTVTSAQRCGGLDLILLGDDLTAGTAWRAAPGRLLVVTGDSVLFLGEPEGQQLPLLIDRLVEAR